MNTGWTSKPEVQDVILGILRHSLHHLLPHFLSAHSDLSASFLVPPFSPILLVLPTPHRQ